eukprot:361193-Chlamydomonas_euryale.AAC.2
MRIHRRNICRQPHFFQSLWIFIPPLPPAPPPRTPPPPPPRPLPLSHGGPHPSMDGCLADRIADSSCALSPLPLPLPLPSSQLCTGRDLFDRITDDSCALSPLPLPLPLPSSQLCTGGDLFDRITDDSCASLRTEASTAAAFHGVIAAIKHFHSMNVLHRDVRPENFMFVDSSPGAGVKCVDFGSAAWSADVFDVVGSPHYIAPELLLGDAGDGSSPATGQADVWSAGVMLYVMLSGYAPFDGPTQDAVFESIVGDPLNLKTAPWPNVSPAAKELVRKMLLRDPKRRFSPDQVRAHEAAADAPATAAAAAAPRQRRRPRRQCAQQQRCSSGGVAVAAVHDHGDPRFHAARRSHRLTLPEAAPVDPPAPSSALVDLPDPSAAPVDPPAPAPSAPNQCSPPSHAAFLGMPTSRLPRAARPPLPSHLHPHQAAQSSFVGLYRVARRSWRLAWKTAI